MQISFSYADYVHYVSLIFVFILNVKFYFVRTIRYNRQIYYRKVTISQTDSMVYTVSNLHVIYTHIGSEICLLWCA